MSEYQYCERPALGRLLPPTEQAAMDRLPSHIDVTSSRAVVTYSWGDFKHDPIQVLARYFDAFLWYRQAKCPLPWPTGAAGGRPSASQGRWIPGGSSRTRGVFYRTDAGLDACNRPGGSIGRIPGGMR
jgi:hypothetical protein